MLSNREKATVGEIRFGIRTLVHNMNLTDEELDIVSRMNEKLDTLNDTRRNKNE